MCRKGLGLDLRFELPVCCAPSDASAVNSLVGVSGSGRATRNAGRHRLPGDSEASGPIGDRYEPCEAMQDSGRSICHARRDKQVGSGGNRANSAAIQELPVFPF